MLIPKNLGQIEFLRDHPSILEHLIRNSRDKSLSAYIDTKQADSKDGGFVWKDTREGHHFWEAILVDLNTDIYYSRYPTYNRYPTNNKSKTKDFSTKLLNNPKLLKIN